MSLIRSIIALACATLAGASPGSARAQPFPSKPIRIIVPFPPGGPTDVYARVIGQKMQESFVQTVVVDNRAGGTGIIGTRAVMQAAPDGHTLLFTSNGAHLAGPLAQEPRPFDSVRDFTPISMAIRYPMYLLVNPAVPAQNIAEFIALIKANPGKYSFSSVGTGSGTHLGCELFNMIAGTSMLHVPYKGAAPAQAAVLSGEVQLVCDSVGNSQAFVDAGKLRGLALTGERRSAGAPGIPTLAEAGLPGVNTYTWLGMLGPAGMPRDVATRIHAETVRIMNLPEVRERVVKGGSDVIANTPEQFAADMRAEAEVWLRVIRERKIKPE
jgi:tripartite-type tricarboxylate transporter receptor subunit TctC